MDNLEFKYDKWTFKIPKTFVYNENDFWAKINGNIAQIGITDFLQNMVGDIIIIEFPALHSKIEQFDEAGSFESVKTMTDVISPVTGVVREVNAKLEENPEIANTDPYGEGWFLTVNLSDWETDKENLIDADSYLAIMKQKVEKEHEKLK